MVLSHFIGPKRFLTGMAIFVPSIFTAHMSTCTAGTVVLPVLLVTDIQYRYVCICHISPSLITVARVHSTLHPSSSNQCDTARLESKLSSIQIMLIVT
jgi:hypothetical protein